jgi:hypothetical protein
MSMSREARRLREFMQERYPHRVGENDAWTDAAIVDAAIALLTPGDGSDAAWVRMRAACGLEGRNAQLTRLHDAMMECESDGGCNEPFRALPQT